MYVTLETLRQGEACKPGFKRVVTYFVSILKNKQQHIPLWALGLSGGSLDDLEWALGSCFVLDEKEFQSFYAKTFPWLFDFLIRHDGGKEMRTKAYRVEKSFRLKQGAPCYEIASMLRSEQDVLLGLTVDEVKSAFDKTVFYQHGDDNYEDMMKELGALWPSTLRERRDYIALFCQLCRYNVELSEAEPESEPEDDWNLTSSRIRARHTASDESDDESDDDGAEEERTPIVRKKEKNWELRDYEDGRMLINWKLSPVERFASMFDVDGFFEQLPTKHGSPLGDTSVVKLKSLEPDLHLEKDRDGRLIRAIFVTKDPRMIHRIDRMLSLYKKGSTLVDDRC